MQNQRRHTLWRILGAVGLALPTLYWSPMWGSWLHYTPVSFPLAIFVPALFATASLALLGRSRGSAAIAEIKDRNPAEATLAGLALAAGFFFSVVVLVVQATHLGFAGIDFWWQLALLLIALELGDSLAHFATKRVHLGFANHLASTGSVESAEFIPGEVAKTTKQTMFWVVIGVAAVAAVTAIAWSFGAHAEPAVALERAISVLAVASPLAVNIIAPLVQTVALAQAKRDHAMVNDVAAFEAARTVDLVLFDKTGILTTGVRSLESLRITRRGGLEDDAELLAVLAGLEVENEHSLAVAILEAAKTREIEPAEIKDLMNIPGIGVSGRIGEYRMMAGGPGLLTRQKIDIDVQDLYAADAMNTAGQTVIYVARDNILLGMVGIGDETRPESADAIWEIHALRQKAGLLTGDAQGVAKALASSLKMDETYAEVLPHDKASVIEKLQAAGRVVAVVGDPATDEAALTQANLGLAFAVETLAECSAHVAIQSNDPEVVAKVLGLSKRAYTKQIQSLWIAGGFNVVAVLLAAGVIQPLHQVFVPAVSALISALATAVVVNGIGGLWSKR
jgi:P-type Cu2+ transporter